MKKRLGSVLLLILLPFVANALPEVRVGVLKYGTVNWEVDVIKHHGLDKKYQFELKVMPLGSKNASAVALQSHAVDIILSDWLWVNRQRFEDRNYTMFPTSIATGGLYVAHQSGINSLVSLKAQKIGIAGGAVDKNWLLLQAYSKKKYGFDIKAQSQPTFATPPLLNKLMLRGDLAGAINFWHYGARLKAAGLRLLVTVPEMLKELGIDHNVPLLGWVFDQAWAGEHRQALISFLRASLEAKQILYSSEQEWQRIRALTKAESPEVFAALKSNYRAGLLRQFGSEEIAAAQRIFSILAQQGGSSLVGRAKTLSDETFWRSSGIKLAITAKDID